METKAIFLDVDGTLVSFDTHRVPQSAIEALQQVHESGIKIIIATGRAFTDLHELEEIPYDAVIALNGADCVLRDGTPISRKQIPEKDFQRVLVLAQHYGFALAIETNKGIFVNELNPTVTLTSAKKGFHLETESPGSCAITSFSISSSQYMHN